METYKRGLAEATGWLVFLSLLMLLALAVPKTVFDADSKDFILLIGAVGIWRYSMGGVHFLRGMLFLHAVYPYYRRRVRQLGSAADPSHVFLMVTSFRIDALTTAMVYRSVIREAIDSGYPTTVVCSIVEMSDEVLVRSLWEKMNPPDRVSLDFVRIPGTGKRDGLAYGFRAISRHLPDDDAVVAVIDGDTVLDHGVVKKTVPWFKLFPNVGGLTTNEFCEVQGGYVMSEWHKLRFAQRHINMCSMALSKRVLTMTGRMSVFRARVGDQPRVHHRRRERPPGTLAPGPLQVPHRRRQVQLVQPDAPGLRHLLRARRGDQHGRASAGEELHQGQPQADVPLVRQQPAAELARAQARCAAPGLVHPWWCCSTSASRCGPACSAWWWRSSPASSTASPSCWCTCSGSASPRLVLTLLLSLSGHRIGPAYPLILYYNQIVGALVKIYVFFRLDRQSWTRQPTKLERGLASFQRWFNAWSSRAMTFSAASIFVAVLLTIV
ncbi:alginate biosynthesis protein [Pseudomonas aeruginosa]|nr:alginate biosynthesis protein [Pseudomonas aeruginosa]